MNLREKLQGPATSALVDCGVYLDGQRVSGEFTPAEARNRVRELGDGFVWVGLHEPDERQMQAVAEVFGLHPLAVEDAVHAHQRPKLERYDDTLFLVLKTVQYVPHENAPPRTPLTRAPGMSMLTNGGVGSAR